jgi:hypothetical protein
MSDCFRIPNSKDKNSKTRETKKIKNKNKNKGDTCFIQWCSELLISYSVNGREIIKKRNIEH